MGNIGPGELMNSGGRGVWQSELGELRYVNSYPQGM